MYRYYFIVWINNIYFSKLHELVGLCFGDTVYFVWVGTHIYAKAYLKVAELSAGTWNGKQYSICIFVT